MVSTVFHFDNAESFPLLETETTALGPVTTGVAGSASESFLRLSYQRHRNDGRDARVVIALPMRAIYDTPEKLLLEVRGDGSGSEVLLEAGDAQGWGFTYSFGILDFSGWRVISTDAQHPVEYWGGRKQDGTPGVVPPVQPFRLGVVLGKSCYDVDLGFRTLSVTGDARVAPPGIASV